MFLLFPAFAHHPFLLPCHLFCAHLFHSCILVVNKIVSPGCLLPDLYWTCWSSSGFGYGANVNLQIEIWLSIWQQKNLALCLTPCFISVRGLVSTDFGKWLSLVMHEVMLTVGEWLTVGECSSASEPESSPSGHVTVWMVYCTPQTSRGRNKINYAYYEKNIHFWLSLQIRKHP